MQVGRRGCAPPSLKKELWGTEGPLGRAGGHSTARPDKTGWNMCLEIVQTLRKLRRHLCLRLSACCYFPEIWITGNIFFKAGEKSKQSEGKGSSEKEDGGKTARGLFGFPLAGPHTDVARSSAGEQQKAGEGEWRIRGWCRVEHLCQLPSMKVK